MSEFVTYVLYSPKYGKVYTGYTSNLIQRIKSHNKLSSKGFTKRFRPWIVIAVEFHTSKKAALQREHYLKSGVGRKYVHQVLLPPYS